MYGCIRCGEVSIRKKRVGLILFLVAFGFFSEGQALRKEPWLYSPWDIRVNVGLDFDFFSTVADGFNPIDYNSNNTGLLLGIVLPVSPVWEFEGEMVFESTSKNNFGFENIALQARRGLLSDTEGDVVSLDVGANVRFLPFYWTEDVAIPYHYTVNFELFGSIGKEYAKEADWLFRTFGFLGIGQAIKGYPWIRALFDIKAKVAKQFLFGVVVDSYFGTGSQTAVNVNQFHSYSNIGHQSVDVGFTFAYQFEIWGKLSFEFDHRFYARAFPDQWNNFLLKYELPIGI